MTTLRHVAWRHPHWWAIALCAVAWAWLLVRWWNGRVSHGQHVQDFAMIDWTLMIATMMLPLVFDHLRVTAARSLWTRRHRAMLGFLCGYAAIWLLVGVVLSIAMAALAVIGTMPRVTPVDTEALPHGVAGVLPQVAPHAAGAWWAALAFAGAAAWQLSPLKRRALIACHRTVPLAPRGWRAHRDCVRYGWLIGRSCLTSCAVLMLACAFAGHSLPAMVAATGVAGAERVSARADAWTTSTVLAFVAVGTLFASSPAAL